MPSKIFALSSSECPKRFRAMAFAAPILMFLALSLWPLHTAVAAQDSRATPLLLTRDEGMAIVQTISEHRQSLRRHGSKPDCSHLVNDVYDLAGFPYFYAKSSDLYRGHPSFVRVNTPQPGDLIVWRGHVGLVTDPLEHFFYSSLRSGLDIEDYTSPYWHKHGAPRFYRYRIKNDEPRLFARRELNEGDADRVFKTLPVKQSSSEISDQSSSTESPASLVRASNDSAARQEYPADVNSNAPTAILIATGRDKPTFEQVNEAISKMNQSLLTGLNAVSLLRSPSTLVIFNHLQVERLVFKGKHGWADVTVSSDASWRGGVLDKTARHDQQRWEINRAKPGWTVSLPSENIYLPRAVAVRIFARQLAHLTGMRDAQVSDAIASQESDLASLLNGLLNK